MRFTLNRNSKIRFFYKNYKTRVEMRITVYSYERVVFRGKWFYKNKSLGSSKISRRARLRIELLMIINLFNSLIKLGIIQT